MNTTNVSEGTTTRPAKVFYTANARTTGGREGGASRTSDGRLDVKLTVPGMPGNGTNPEQLLAAGWSLFLERGKDSRLSKEGEAQTDPVIDAGIDLCTGDDGYSLRARLNVSLPGLDRQVAQSLLEQTCPYSKATRGNIDVAINLI
jgi:Ohr subfamily peroxiredoxin